MKRANELLKAQANAKGGRVVAEIVSEGLPVEVTCRVVVVSVSGLSRGLRAGGWGRQTITCGDIRGHAARQLLTTSADESPRRYLGPAPSRDAPSDGL